MFNPRPPVEGAGLPGWLPRVPTGLVVTGPRPPVEGAGLPGWLPRTGWVLTGPRPRPPVEGAGLPGLGLTGPLPVYPAGGFPPIKRDM
jgi:hypothetical protein